MHNTIWTSRHVIGRKLNATFHDLNEFVIINENGVEEVDDSFPQFNGVECVINAIPLPIWYWIHLKT